MKRANCLRTGRYTHPGRVAPRCASLVPGCCVLVLLGIPAAGAEARGAESIPVSSMLLKLVEQVDVPARETGVLASVEAREGQLVRQGDLLAQIDDTEAKIAEEQAKIDIEIARASASNDVNLRFAKKSVEVAKAELRRTDESNEKYPRSVSESEVDRLRLLVEKSSLEVEQAEHEYAVAKLMLQAKEGEYRLAQQKAQRHQVPSPLDGIVVQVYRHRGEWVKPGEPVVRILRMDRLRAEGFVKAELAGQHLMGRAVRLVLNRPGSPPWVLSGKIVFLDPEIDPVTHQVRIWAEVENKDLRLSPGMQADMTIEPQAKSAQQGPKT